MLAVFWLEAEVNNGGFNSAATTPRQTAGLKEIGAVGAAALLEQPMSVFPGGKPPAEDFKRQEVLDQIAAWSRPVWTKCDSEPYKFKESMSDLSLDYARKKKSEILLP